MPNPEELIQALAELDPATLENVINTAYNRRRDPADRAGRAGQTPRRGRVRSHAGSHSGTWKRTRRSSGLCTFRQVLRIMKSDCWKSTGSFSPPDNDVIEPLDFTPDIADVPFRVFVADVTRDQWERIQRDPDASLRSLGWQTGG